MTRSIAAGCREGMRSGELLAIITAITAKEDFGRLGE